MWLKVRPSLLSRVIAVWNEGPAGRDRSPSCIAPVALLAAALALSAGALASAQSAGAGESRILPGHVPWWATPDHYVAPVPDDLRMGTMTLVLERKRGRQQAFEQLLAAQQDPASPEYHRWLTSAQIGERFGLADSEIDALAAWIESQGLHVDWIAPARNFIGFSGTAGGVARMFQTELDYYDVEGTRKISVAADPMLPAELAHLVKAVRGLHTIEEKPLSEVHAVRSDSPALTVQNSEGQTFYFVAPADFYTIYDFPGNGTGKGITIGIAAGSRTNLADFKQFRSLTGTNFPDPSQFVPTAYGAADPGAAYTAPQASTVDIGPQVEATLDVMRAGSIAPDANLLLVINKPAQDGSVDIGPDAQYLIQTDPLPAQVVNISFGSCESAEGASGVSHWDELFQQAAAKGISVFVASGDSGAAGCDPYNAAPPSNPLPNSPNYLCSSSYVTCVGGTEFNDASEYSKYWNAKNGAELESARGYIPEGAWNEPMDTNNNPATTQASATGGGVSQFIPTPAWQKGTGVPSGRSGRYTPDLAFSAATHDGYFGCMAAASGSCVATSQGTPFVYFAGTSAAAPDMAGIAAIFDEVLGSTGQGNFDPLLYSMAASTPSAFHDVTVASSGVQGCSVSTPSICNNSVPSSTALKGGQAGFLVGTGFDEATGLGSLDVGKFFKARFGPAVTDLVAISISASAATLSASVNANGQSTYVDFYYSTYPNLAAEQPAGVLTVSSSSAVTVKAPVTKLRPGTKYYFQIVSGNDYGAVTSSVASFTTPKGSQTITFEQPKTPLRYGVAPLALSASSSSHLPVAFRVVSGPAKVSDSTLTITGVGTVAVAASQAGSSSYLPAGEVTRTITVGKAELNVIANDESMTMGAAVPTLAFHMTGWVNSDTRYTATEGLPLLTTSATSKSPLGSYPIDISAGAGVKGKNLTSSKYGFHFVSGTMTVQK
jgi:subtilase family serine protease